MFGIVSLAFTHCSPGITQITFTGTGKVVAYLNSLVIKMRDSSSDNTRMSKPTSKCVFQNLCVLLSPKKLIIILTPKFTSTLISHENSCLIQTIFPLVSLESTGRSGGGSVTKPSLQLNQCHTYGHLSRPQKYNQRSANLLAQTNCTQSNTG